MELFIYSTKCQLSFFVCRKHDRKGIARRVSNFSSEGESVSPDIPVVVPEQVYNVHPPSFPVHIEAPPASNYHDFSNPVVSISVAEALRSHSPVVVQPTPNFNMWNGSVNEQAENVNPPTMATSVYAQMPSTSVVNAMPVLPLQHPSQPTSAPSISSSHMDQQWTGPRMRGIPVEIQPVAPQAPVHMTRSKNGLGQPPPLVVHLKDRGACLALGSANALPLEWSLKPPPPQTSIASKCHFVSYLLFHTQHCWVAFYKSKL